MHKEDNKDLLESHLPERTAVTISLPTPQAVLKVTGFLSWGEG